MEFKKVKDLKPSPDNTREITKESVKELADSMLKFGVIVPLIVTKDGTIIAGHRRHLAAQIAEITEVPVIVRDDTKPEDIKVIRLMENIQRTDLHPMEEAESFWQLMKIQKGTALTLDQAAVSLGKKVAYVRVCIQLMKLLPEAKKAFKADKFESPVAFALSRLEDEQSQKEAFQLVMKNLDDDSRELVSMINRHFQHTFKQCYFDANDAKLYPKAGACVTCSKRASNQSALFTDIDVKKDDRCLDKNCWNEKIKATIQKTIEEAKEKKFTVISSQYTPNGYTELNENCYKDKQQRHWKDVLKGVEIEKVLVITEEAKKYWVVKSSDIIPAIEKAGLKVLAKSLKENTYNSSAGMYEKERKKKIQQKKVFAVALKSVYEKSSAPPSTFKNWFAMFMASQASNDVARMVIQSCALPYKKAKYGQDFTGNLKREAQATKKPWALAMTIACAGGHYPGGVDSDTSKAVFKLFSIDLSKIEASLKKDAVKRKKGAVKK